MNAEDRLNRVRDVIAQLGYRADTSSSFTIADHEYLETGFLNDLLVAIDD